MIGEKLISKDNPFTFKVCKLTGYNKIMGHLSKIEALLAEVTVEQEKLREAGLDITVTVKVESSNWLQPFEQDLPESLRKKP